MPVICERCIQPQEIGEHGWMLCPLEPRKVGLGVIDDQIDGGPRRFETMGDDAPFISTKSEWRREVAARGLVNVDKYDRAHYQRMFRQHDEKLRDERAQSSR